MAVAVIGELAQTASTETAVSPGRSACLPRLRHTHYCVLTGRRWSARAPDLKAWSAA